MGLLLNNDKKKEVIEAMKNAIEELEILANNVREPAEVQRVIMRSSVLSNRLMSDLIEAVKSGTRRTAIATEAMGRVLVSSPPRLVPTRRCGMP